MHYIRNLLHAWIVLKKVLEIIFSLYFLKFSIHYTVLRFEGMCLATVTNITSRIVYWYLQMDQLNGRYVFNFWQGCPRGKTLFWIENAANKHLTDEIKRFQVKFKNRTVKSGNVNHLGTGYEAVQNKRLKRSVSFNTTMHPDRVRIAQTGCPPNDPVFPRTQQRS